MFGKWGVTSIFIKTMKTNTFIDCSHVYFFCPGMNARTRCVTYWGKFKSGVFCSWNINNHCHVVFYDTVSVLPYALYRKMSCASHRSCLWSRKHFDDWEATLLTNITFTRGYVAGSTGGSAMHFPSWHSSFTVIALWCCYWLQFTLGS